MNANITDIEVEPKLGIEAQADIKASALRRFRLGGLQFPAAPQFTESKTLDQLIQEGEQLLEQIPNS